MSVLLVVALGLFWRSGWVAIPYVASKYGGDALWALMIFAGIGFAFPRCPTMRAGFIALLIAWSVEFLQLYHGAWIDAFRSTLPGRLMLGSTFNGPDLVAYLVGIVLGVLAESAHRRSGPSDPA